MGVSRAASRLASEGKGKAPRAAFAARTAALPDQSLFCAICTGGASVVNTASRGSAIVPPTPRAPRPGPAARSSTSLEPPARLSPTKRICSAARVVRTERLRRRAVSGVVAITTAVPLNSVPAALVSTAS